MNEKNASAAVSGRESELARPHLLEPGMEPSVSGPTACAIGASPKQASVTPSAMKSDGVVALNLIGIFI
jgi:hypothetical protein